MPLAELSYGQQKSPAPLAEEGGAVGGVSTTYDLSAMYDSVNPVIAKVITDRGHGSGFLIDTRGLIATNFHVVRNSRYFAVQFANGMKYQAVVAMEDVANDIAILRVNEDVVQGLTPLMLLPETQLLQVKPGTPVAAFGSPLNTTFLVTQGVVSKVEKGGFLGDYLIAPGSSGGPLLNLSGQVIGINTFASGGVAGAVRVSVLRQLLEDALPEMSMIDKISSEPLPMLRNESYPTEAIRQKMLIPPLDDDSYGVKAGQFTINALTPVRLARLHVVDDLLQAENRLERRGGEVSPRFLETTDAAFYEWHGNAARSTWLDYAVKFEIKPEYGATAGSLWANIALASLAGFSQGFTGVPQPWSPVHANFEFKAEFLDLQLFRHDNPRNEGSGELIEPIHPGRQVTEAAFRNYDMTFVDEAYSGMYSYSPEVFLTPNTSFTLVVIDARKPAQQHAVVRLDSRSELLRQIQIDFADTDLLGEPDIESEADDVSRLIDTDLLVEPVIESSVPRLDLPDEEYDISALILAARKRPAVAGGGSREDLYNLGEVEFAKDDMDAAAGWYEKAAALDPTWAKPFFKLALVQLNKGDMESAKAFFAQVVEKDPSSEEGKQAQATLDALP